MLNSDLSHHGVASCDGRRLRGQFVFEALERDSSSDTDSMEARSTAFEGPSNSERADAELEPYLPLMRFSQATM